MGFREIFKKKQSATVVVASLVIVGAGIAIYVQARDFGGSRGGDAYFTADDGQTLFVDDSVKNLPPFEHEGKQAVRAHVFVCNGKRVVGYLSRYTAESLQVIAEAKAAHDAGRSPPNVAKLSSLAQTGLELKRPGEKNTWVRQTNMAQAAKIRVFRCADGKAPPEVYP